FSGDADNVALGDRRSKLSYWRDGAWMLPDETRNVTSTSLIGTGVDHVDVDSVPDWIHPGANLMFVNGPVRDVRQVESISGNTVTFTTEMARAWPADSIIRPAMTSYLGKDIKVTRLNADAANVAVNHEVVERNPDNVPDATKIMAGREILEVQPNYAAGLDDSHPMAREVIDYGFGQRARFTWADRPEVMREATYIGLSADKVRYLQVFFERHRGQLGEFWTPTWQRDIVLAEALTSGNALLKHDGADVYHMAQDNTAYRGLMVLLKDGTRIYRQVTAVGLTGGQSQITVDTNWPSTIQPGEIEMISWMPVWRLASDKMVIEKTQQDKANVK